MSLDLFCWLFIPLKYRFLIWLIWFLHFRLCYKFQIRLQENQIHSLFFNSTLKCLDLVLENLSSSEFVWFGCAGEAEHSVLNAPPLNFISRRLFTISKQWIILLVWESNFQKYALAAEISVLFQLFLLLSSKMTMNVTNCIFCTPSLFYVLTLPIYWFYYSSLQEERN